MTTMTCLSSQEVREHTTSCLIIDLCGSLLVVRHLNKQYTFSFTATRVTSTDSILRRLDEVYGGAIETISEGNDLLHSINDNA
jgi:hypothetical protein